VGNLAIFSVGRRVNLVKKFKQELNAIGLKVIAIDRDINAPALYFADKYYIAQSQVFEDPDVFYVRMIEDLKKMNVTHVISLHDVQLRSWCVFRKLFEDVGIKVLMSDNEAVKNCYDKQLFYDNYKDVFNIPETTILKNKEGFASFGVERVKQPFIRGQEYNVQCYFDFLTGRPVSYFMQKKILMRAGETDRSINAWSDELSTEISKIYDIGLKGAIDIDALVTEDKVYIIDINPRFGGGYLLAHECGFNFIKFVVNNMQEIENEFYEYSYKEFDKKMIKYEEVMFL
jgi:carbamoyl-phosphate synthase large subunit